MIAELITSVYSFPVVAPTLSVAVAVKLNVPDAVGVPLSTPPDESVTPLGSPAEAVNVDAPVPPVAVSIWL